MAPGAVPRTRLPSEFQPEPPQVFVEHSTCIAVKPTMTVSLFFLPVGLGVSSGCGHRQRGTDSVAIAGSAFSNDNRISLAWRP